jgi:hypothetical protein
LNDKLDNWQKAVDVGASFILAISTMRLAQRKRIFAMAVIGCCLLLAAAGSGEAVAFSSSGGYGEKFFAARMQLAKSEEEARQSVNRRKATKLASASKAQSQRTPNVIVKAVMARRRNALTNGVSWRVLTKRKHKLIWSGSGGDLRIHLKPGRYIVEASYGLAKKRRTIRVRKRRRVNERISLNAGTIRAKATAVLDGPMLRETTFTLYEAARNEARKRTAPITKIIPISTNKGASVEQRAKIAHSTLPSTSFHVPAGDYRLVVRRGMAVSETYVHVKAGSVAKLNIVMNIGVLRLSAHAESGDPPISGVRFAVYDADKDKLLLKTRLDEQELTLPAGAYRMTVDLGLVHEERKLEVKAGQNHTETLVLNAGWLKLSAVTSGDKRPMTQDIRYKIFDLSAKGAASNQALTTITTPATTIFLKRGKYRVESQYGSHNARLVHDVNVTAGNVSDVKCEYRVSSIKLKLVAKPGAEPVEKVKWTLKYADGGTVLISQDAAPDLILQTGRYQVMAQHNAKTYSRTFEAVANREHIIELIAE